MDTKLNDGLYFKKGNSFYLISENIMNMIDLNEDKIKNSYKINDIYIDDKLVNFKKILINENDSNKKEISNKEEIKEIIESVIIENDNNSLKYDLQDNKEDNQKNFILKDYNEFQSNYKINRKNSNMRYESIIDCDNIF